MYVFFGITCFGRWEPRSPPRRRWRGLLTGGAGEEVAKARCVSCEERVRSLFVDKHLESNWHRGCIMEASVSGAAARDTGATSLRRSAEEFHMPSLRHARAVVQARNMSSIPTRLEHVDPSSAVFLILTALIHRARSHIACVQRDRCRAPHHRQPQTLRSRLP